MEIIWDECFTNNEIRAALEQLPKGLDETYQRCMKRIEEMKNIRPLRALRWINFATRPLHIKELREAITFDLHDTVWDSGKIPPRDFAVGCCSNLAILDSNDDCVYLAHSSVKQFLEKYVAGRTPGYCTSSLQGELECGELCINYLSFSNFGLQLEKSIEFTSHALSPMALATQSVRSSLLNTFPFQQYTRKMPSYPLKIQMVSKTAPNNSQYRFLDYAILNWPLHTKHITQQSSLWQKFERLALQYSETWNFHPWRSSGRSAHSYLHGLLIWAVKEQHQPLLSIALYLRKDLQKICNLPSTEESLPVLHIASRLGYETMVKVLLDFCSVDLLDQNGYTPLHHAANKGHIKVVKLLLGTKGSEVNIQPKFQNSPLLLAASNGHEAIVKLLLDQGADLEAKGNNGQTPLSCAADRGQEAIVKLLLNRGANLEAKDSLLRQTPLSWAAKRGHEAIVKLLLDRGADLDAKDNNGQTPLSWAADRGHEAVMKLLLDRDA